MAFRLIWSPTARLDIKQITNYISENSPLTARRFIKKIFQTVERLTDFPESGRIVPEFENPEIREVIRSPFRIVYKFHSEKKIIEIVRVWHGSRGSPDIESHDEIY